MAKEKLEILYEHEDFIAVSKPAGVLSIPDRFNKEKNNLLKLLRDKYGDILTVHRLDRDTSGVILYARNAAMHKYLNTLFENNQVDKTYHALVEGVLNTDEGIIEAAIANDPNTAGKMRIFHKGKYAKTAYRLLERYKRFSLVEAKIFTGRTHQIRVHLKHIGHAIVSDPMYGTRTALYITDIKFGAHKSQDEEQIPLIARTALHAYQIRFRLPEKGEYIEIMSPYPKDFRAAINQLGKHYKSKEI